MRWLAALVLYVAAAAQSVTYTATLHQPGNGVSTLSCFDPGEQLCFGEHMMCGNDSGHDQFVTWSFGVRPAPIGNDYLFDIGEVVPFCLIAPSPALPGGGAPIGTPPWELLFVNPATVWCGIGTPVQAWKSCPPGGPELIDLWQVVFPVRPDLVGTAWMLQWARAPLTFSNALEVAIW